MSNGARWRLRTARKRRSVSPESDALTHLRSALHFQTLATEALTPPTEDEPVCASGCIGACEGHDREDPWV